MVLYNTLNRNEIDESMTEYNPRPQRHMHIPLEALQTRSTQKYFTDEISLVGFDCAVELAPHEQTPEGFINLAWDHQETQISLYFDLKDVCDGPFAEWPEIMQQRVKNTVAELNTKRTQPIDIATEDEQFLFQAGLPNWSEEHPGDWPEGFRADLELLHEIDSALGQLAQDKELQAEAQALWRERAEIMRQAASITQRERKIGALAVQIATLRAHAAKLDRPLSAGKKRQIHRLEIKREELQENLYKNDLPDYLLGDLDEELERHARREVRRQFEQGLVMTEPMAAVIYEALPSITAGNPALFVGETGGAKTALAKYLSRKCLGKEPEIVSGYADVNGYQLMGKTGLTTTKEGATVSEFVSGPVVRAMEEGRPLILDEINAMPPEFLKRLNEITQLRPGDTTSIQEDSGKVITVRPGFCVLATANEKSKRYAGVEDFSTEFLNRFTANTYRIGYPDADVVVGEDPLDNYKLAYAAVSDRAGNILFEEGPEKLEAFTKAAHLTQRLFSGSITEGLSQTERDVVGSDRLADAGATGLDKNVLAPRTMVALLEKVIDSHGALTLSQVLTRWVDSVKSPHDKKVITTILTTRGLL